MKRDMDLVRAILHRVEDADEGTLSNSWFSVADFDQEVVNRHVQLLVEAGLLVAYVSESEQGVTGTRPERLTWAGHDFLDAARNEGVWQRTRKMIREKAGSVPFDVLKSLLTEGVKTLVTASQRPG